MAKKSPTILFVNCDFNDHNLIKQTLVDWGVESQYHIVESGELLLEYLKGRGEYADRKKYPLPSLVLLDLNLPLMNCKKELKEIRMDPKLKQIPIIVLTDIQDGDDVEEKYELGITGSISKPMTINGMLDVMRTIGNYGFQFKAQPIR